MFSGKTALITGASSGIGEQMARQLAAVGCNLILVARRTERLDSLAGELASVTVDVITADLSDPQAAEAVYAQTQAAGRQVDILINNAGFGDRGQFADLDLQRQLDMVQVNVTALVDLTWRLVPALKQAKDAFVINVASSAAFQAGPNMTIYYATKAFVLSFSEGLHEELKGNGIAVSALCPGATDSEFATEAHMTDTLLFKAGTMTTEAVVKKSLAGRRRAIVIPGLKNLLLVWMGKFSPRMITRRLAGMLQA